MFASLSGRRLNKINSEEKKFYAKTNLERLGFCKPNLDIQAAISQGDGDSGVSIKKLYLSEFVFYSVGLLTEFHVLIKWNLLNILGWLCFCGSKSPQLNYSEEELVRVLLRVGKLRHPPHLGV